MRIWLVAIVAALMAALAGCTEPEAPRPVSLPLEADTSDAAAPTAAPAVTRQVDVGGLRDRALAILREGLSHPSGAIRIHAVEIVATAGRKELMPMVTALLKDELVPVRFAAVLAIGDTGYVPGAFAVKGLLEDADANVQIAAAYTLTRLGDADYSNLIRKALKSKDPSVRANAALLLGKLGRRSDREYLYRMLRASDSGTQARIQAVEALAMLKEDKMYRDKLWPLLISKHADDRVMGIRGMGALGTQDAENALLTMLKDDVAEVRLAAAGELGELGSGAGRGLVYDYLSRNASTMDQNTVGSLLATLAIGQIGGPELTQYLPQLLASKSDLIRLSAAQSVLLAQ